MRAAANTALPFLLTLSTFLLITGGAAASQETVSRLLREAEGGSRAVGEASARELVKFLTDADEGVRKEAEEALVTVGAPSISPVGAFLDSGSTDSDALRRALRILGRTGTPDVVPFLTAFLVRNRKTDTHQQEAFDALANAGVPAVRPLLDLMRYRDLQENVDLALIDFPHEELARALAGQCERASAHPEETILMALKVEEVLGTAGLEEQLEYCYRRISTDDSLAMPTRLRAEEQRWRIFQGDRLEPLGKEVLKARYDDLSREEQRLLEKEREWAEQELNMRRRISAAEQEKRLMEERGERWRKDYYRAQRKKQREEEKE